MEKTGPEIELHGTETRKISPFEPFINKVPADEPESGARKYEHL